MLYFNYDKKYTKNKYKNINKRIESAIEKSTTYSFPHFADIDISIYFVKPNDLSNAVFAKTIDNNIQIRYDLWEQVRRNNDIFKVGSLVYNRAYNVLYHELFHIHNNLIMVDFLKRLEDKISIRYTLDYIKIVLDDFIATKLSTALYNYNYNSYEEIKSLINILTLTNDTLDKYNHFLKLPAILAYTFGQFDYSNSNEVINLKCVLTLLCDDFQICNQLVDCFAEFNCNSNFDFNDDIIIVLESFIVKTLQYLSIEEVEKKVFNK